MHPPYDLPVKRAALSEVIPFHLDGLREGGEAVPLPQSVAEWVEV